jgi:hypothetical protein
MVAGGVAMLDRCVSIDLRTARPADGRQVLGRRASQIVMRVVLY